MQHVTIRTYTAKAQTIDFVHGEWRGRKIEFDLRAAQEHPRSGERSNKNKHRGKGAGG